MRLFTFLIPDVYTHVSIVQRCYSHRLEKPLIHRAICQFVDADVCTHTEGYVRCSVTISICLTLFTLFSNHVGLFIISSGYVFNRVQITHYFLCHHLMYFAISH